MTEPIADLDEVVHQRNRLGILTTCYEARRIGFSELCDSLELTVGSLSRHLHVLEEAGLVSLDKTFEARRPKTWVAITRPGRKAFEREVAVLRLIIERAELTAESVPARKSSRASR
jgi:DNA-binding MarR family transcriptional regulator